MLIIGSTACGGLFEPVNNRDVLDRWWCIQRRADERNTTNVNSTGGYILLTSSVGSHAVWLCFAQR